MECWRTPFMLTKQMQDEFYEGCCNRESPHRYFALVRTTDDPIQGVVPESGFIGMGGITYIQWENRIGEITLIINPVERGDGLGEKAVDLLLDHAFNHLNLQTVFGECYHCNDAWEFWGDITDKYDSPNTIQTLLPKRKYWNGDYWDSTYFSIDKDDFNKIHNSK
ncbi:MAG: GNAT family N-acetyltransferase [Thermodesulfovibrionales bacterium]|nr:GNAT family N-acetyltransferase [Thermodesulfovibrionales bacterium]